jgi:pimeloyl-ACP methyl ester carboxylesterase
MIVGAGFSFDWALVQPEVAKFTTVCTYDVSGTAWSDAGPEFTCRERVNEVHKLLRAALLKEPYVLVGLSIGACVARLYAAEYPAEVSGMVIVDHAFFPDPDPDAGKHRLGSNSGLDSPPVLIEQTPIEITVEDASHFGNLPRHIQELHRWAMSLHPKLPTAENAEDCFAQLKIAAPGPFPLDDMPSVVVSTGNQARGYARLQSTLLALSRHSMQMKAERSFHAVEIDQPDVVIAAIRQTVRLTSDLPARR